MAGVSLSLTRLYEWDQFFVASLYFILILELISHRHWLPMVSNIWIYNRLSKHYNVLSKFLSMTIDTIWDIGNQYGNNMTRQNI